MDLATLDLVANAENAAIVHLRNPVTLEPLMNGGQPVTISVKGADGTDYKAAQANSRLALMMYQSPVMRLTQEYSDELQIQTNNVLTAVTTGWSRIQVDGKELKFSRDAARALYDRFPWIKDQVDEAVNDRKRFYPGDPADLQAAE